MKNQLNIVFFVIILGSVTSLLLMGMDVLTKDRIAENELALLKSSVLDANAVSYSFANIHDIFDDEVDMIERSGMIFYVHKSTGNISYLFSGGGVWGPIEGIITLAPDFETIVAISILQQEETPGLGGVVAEPQYLQTFIGVKMIPQIEINKDPAPNLPNEVDAITGATSTSKRFELILNNSYQAHLNVWNEMNG